MFGGIFMTKMILLTKKGFRLRYEVPKKWIDRCDEAEKVLIDKCMFKAYRATNTVCSILAIVLTNCALIFGIGFLPSLVGCVI